jgi:hypothetical protein
MRFKVKKLGIYMTTLLLVCSFIQIGAQTTPDEELFKEAKILIFDKKWEQAQEILEEILSEYPKSRWFSQAMFYKAKCLEEQSGKETQALRVFKEYIRLKDRSESLTEESEKYIIDLSSALYEKGRKSHISEITQRLSSSNKVIRYWAAIVLSYIKDKKIARKAVPVLKDMINKEKIDDLRDRARIALLRIDPDALKDFEEERSEKKAKMLKIRVLDRETREQKFYIAIPWALADLAFSAIPEEEKRDLRKEGYDIDRIIKDLTTLRGEVLMFESEDSIIKIWID